VSIAIIYAGLGDRDDAFVWLDRAIENREFGAVLLDVQIWLDDLRSDPRYEARLKKLGLAQ
jgi:hypothetical protein